MVRRMLLAALAVSPLFIAAGCRHRCCKDGASSKPSPYLPPPPGSFIGPPGGANTIPPTSLPTTPGSSFIPPAGPGAGSGALPPPDFAPPRNFGPPPNTKPGGPDVLFPDPLPGGPSSRSLSPNTGTAPFLGPPVKPVTTSEPPLSKVNTTPQPALTTLPGYTKVKDGVFTGRKPELEGFDSLKQNGFRTLVYLHGAGADVSAARELAHKRGLTFVAIETTPETLTNALDEMNKLVVNSGSKPMYVYDDDGLRAGAVWYLHLRTADAMHADAARVRAKAIGLTDKTDEGKAFWVAINQFLAK